MFPWCPTGRSADEVAVQFPRRFERAQVQREPRGGLGSLADQARDDGCRLVPGTLPGQALELDEREGGLENKQEGQAANVKDEECHDVQQRRHRIGGLAPSLKIPVQV
jgi:hypothetical protein